MTLSESRWQRIRREGWLRCVLVRGALVWGVTFALAFAVVEVMTGRASDFWRAVPDNLPLGFVAGAFYGWGQWGYSQLQSLKEKQEE
ncbi:hypothetical protein [Chitinolyticbacter meiyuanensis]|uniref:hypothetical protein n=1 Tax=Chitinolyticbacter meiyuanensis TaxID=682798 RepID=UPI0011E58956|nr:hypothetical protein [Chitinolyticbacter meiyuanensis]